jgi:hypothetical protein
MMCCLLVGGPESISELMLAWIVSSAGEGFTRPHTNETESCSVGDGKGPYCAKIPPMDLP